MKGCNQHQRNKTNASDVCVRRRSYNCVELCKQRQTQRLLGRQTSQNLAVICTSNQLRVCQYTISCRSLNVKTPEYLQSLGASKALYEKSPLGGRVHPTYFAKVHVHIHNKTATSLAEAQVDRVGARSDCRSPF